MPRTRRSSVSVNKATPIGAQPVGETPVDVGLAVAPAGASAVNQAEAYGVRIVPAQVAPGQEYWRVISVRHLAPEENRGKHNVFVDAQDASGQRSRDAVLRIGWTWEARQPQDPADPKPLDKPDNEPAGNVDLFRGQHVEVWIQGDGLPSDHVANLHTEHPDEPTPSGDLWNSIGHHSFQVVFQRSKSAADGNGQQPEPQPQPDPTPPPAPRPQPEPVPPPPTEFRFEAWPTEFRVITQKFGVNPEAYKPFGLPGHEGIDIKAPTGSKVFCVAPGQVKLVTLVGADPKKPPYGNHVRVLHAGGYETIYGHLQSLSVTEGQPVAAGEVLGLADNTGNSHGSHLHITLKHHGQTFGGYPGSIIDPTPFLAPLLAATSVSPTAPSLGVATNVKVAEKLGLNCNAPTDDNGNITPRVADPGLIAATGVGWVRINFILRPFTSPSDPAWVQNYQKIIRGLRDKGLRIYGLVHAEAVAGDPGNQFRDPPGDSIDNEWIRQYAANFRTIVQQFRDVVDVWESFNEPNNWHEVDKPNKEWKKAWVDPGWFAVMLQRVYEAVRDLNIKLVSGPVLSTPFGNDAAVYLPNVYAAGMRRFGWGSPGSAVPFDGVGFHPYPLFDTNDPTKDIPPKYEEYLRGVRDVIKRAEGGNLRPIYVSEIGFQNAEDRQAECMNVGLRCALDDPSVALCFWYGMQDDPGESYGLYRMDGLTPDKQKPVYRSFVELARENRQVPAATGRPALLVPNATFVAELDKVKDGTVMAPGSAFAKIWRMKNTGTATWGDGYRLLRVEGDSLGAPASVNVPPCAPGKTVDISVPFVASDDARDYTSVWQLVDPKGQRFGQKVWTKIKVQAVGLAPAAAQAMGLAPAEALEMPLASAPFGLLPAAAPASAQAAVGAALGIIYTTYWLRVQAAMSAADPQQALQAASNDALAQIKEWLR